MTRPLGVDIKNGWYHAMQRIERRRLADHRLDRRLKQLEKQLVEDAT
jgi:hypothetical protein